MRRGRIADAARVYDGIEETIRRVDLRHPCVIVWAGEAIDVALAAGEVEAAVRRTEWLEVNSAPEMGVWPRMIALAGRAGAAAACGERDRADELFAAAVADPCPLELERARTVLRYGTWLRHQGQAVRARSWLAEALRTAEARGAAPMAEEARQELSAAGGRRRRSPGENTLTTQQARVATLAATGATNREIAGQLHISSRTVESHLAAALLKLNVRTRFELRQRRRELGLFSA
jgi:DNA-binding CsgD family transcriptional regulator